MPLVWGIKPKGNTIKPNADLKIFLLILRGNTAKKPKKLCF